MTEGRDLGKEFDKAKWAADVTECLRTYDMLGLWQDAEEVIRSDVVRAFVKKVLAALSYGHNSVLTSVLQTIYPGCLAAPHSPVMPNTPFPPVRSPAPPTTGMIPRTPYTPFTAFASKQNPFEVNFEQPHILDDDGDSLAALFNTILRFVDRDLKRIMEIADKASVKPNSRSKAAMGKAALIGSVATQGKNSSGGFEIMANVVWAEIGKAIMDELGNVVFAVGKPEEFRKVSQLDKHSFIHDL